MDSPARNPSPPPELREHAELLAAERIGNTAFSKHWLFTTLMKLIEEVDRENEEGKNTDLMVDVDEDLQNELCKLWDMSMNSEVSKFLEEFQAVDILTGIIEKSKAPRVTEICVGILGNMACDQTVCKRMSEKQKLIEIVLLLLESRDRPTLVEATRLIYTSVSNIRDTRGPWLNAIRRSEEVLGHLLFIFKSSTNCDLLKNTAELVDVLLDLEPDLCVSWATEDFIQALLEATEQIGSNNTEALEVYLHIFQSFSTTEPGVEALVAHLDYIVGKLLKYLNIVCEYEIVGVDRMERPLTSALSVLNIIFTSQIENKDKHCIQSLCKVQDSVLGEQFGEQKVADVHTLHILRLARFLRGSRTSPGLKARTNYEKLMRILLKILEPLYPMLQKYKEERNLNSDNSEPIADTENQVIPADQSEKTNGSEATNIEPKSDSKAINGCMDQTEVEEYRQLNILYEVLSGFLIDYSKHLFQDSASITVHQEPEKASQSTECTGENSESKESNCGEAKIELSSENKEDNSGAPSNTVLNESKPEVKNIIKNVEAEEDNSEETDSKEELQPDKLEGNVALHSSKEKFMEEDSQTEEMEKLFSSKDDERKDISHNRRHEQNVEFLPILTYLDEACSRCRINNFALTLKSKVEEKGNDLLGRIYEMAQRFDKERLIRILNDISSGRVVTRAESAKLLGEPDT